MMIGQKLKLMFFYNLVFYLALIVSQSRSQYFELILYSFGFMNVGYLCYFIFDKSEYKVSNSYDKYPFNHLKSLLSIKNNYILIFGFIFLLACRTIIFYISKIFKLDLEGRYLDFSSNLGDIVFYICILIPFIFNIHYLKIIWNLFNELKQKQRLLLALTILFCYSAWAYKSVNVLFLTETTSKNHRSYDYFGKSDNI